MARFFFADFNECEMLKNLAARIVAGSLLLVSSSLAWAIAPYILAEKLKPAETAKVAEDVEARLKSAGFQVLGRYFPKQLPDYGVVVVADDAILNDIRAMGGANVIGAGIRVGVKSDGTVTYMNPDYWYRAYFRGQYAKAEKSVRAVQEKLARTLGAGLGFGGNEDAEVLPKYRYIVGMERFDSDKNKLAEHVSFDQAVKTVRENLANGVAHTSKVYEVVMPEEKIAVFGVAMNDPVLGEGRWMAKIGAQEGIAALPYEIYVVNNTVNSLYGRYRIAVSFPNLNMAHFMRIVSTPNEIMSVLGAVAGVKANK
jgi:hypothetical protein